MYSSILGDASVIFGVSTCDAIQDAIHDTI